MANLTFSDDPTYMKLYTCSETRRAKAIEAWGTPTTVADVQAVFRRYYGNEISLLPWCVCLAQSSCCCLGCLEVMGVWDVCS